MLWSPPCRNPVNNRHDVKRECRSHFFLRRQQSNFYLFFTLVNWTKLTQARKLSFGLSMIKDVWSFRFCESALDYRVRRLYETVDISYLLFANLYNICKLTTDDNISSAAGEICLILSYLFKHFMKSRLIVTSRIRWTTQHKLGWGLGHPWPPVIDASGTCIEK